LRPFKLLAESRAEQRRLQTPEFRASLERLNTRIFEAAQACAENHHSEFLVVYLASGIFINDVSQDDAGEKFMDAFLKNHQTPYLDTRKVFLAGAQNRKWNQAHYGEPESQLVAATLLDKIHAGQSWKDYLQQHQAK